MRRVPESGGLRIANRFDLPRKTIKEATALKEAWPSDVFAKDQPRINQGSTRDQNDGSFQPDGSACGR
jgi:hypothetical protein